MTVTHEWVELGLLRFLEDCEAMGKAPTRGLYRRWRESDAPNASYGMNVTVATVTKHYGSWEEAMRQVAPAYKERQEERARDPEYQKPDFQNQIAKSISPRPKAKIMWWMPL